MNEVDILELGRETTWVILLVSGPVMAIGMVVGVAIALVQALTSLQESTLTFVPKIVAMMLGLVVLLPFMMTTLIEFTQRLFDHIAAGG
ncbi:MAG: flagellar biosynthesis protein FliQ [Rhodospirillales bacterium]|nr:flagellar biosynthesis protein FliQ [Rhodospirillales bacterium]